jgi:hypothetical protein
MYLDALANARYWLEAANWMHVFFVCSCFACGRGAVFFDDTFLKFWLTRVRTYCRFEIA